MRRRLALLLLLAIISAACGAQTGASGGATEPAAADPPPSEGEETEPAEEEPTDAEATEAEEDSGTGGATVVVAASDLGEILADGENATLYAFLPDEQGESTCYDDCEQNWPPLVAPAEAGDGVDAALLGEVEREDGTMQVTYNDWPLYYFAGDASAGDVAGQGVGDVWYVVDPAGEPITSAQASQSYDY